MKQIRLNKGYIALVDNEDFEKLSKLTWFISDTGYAKNTFLDNEKKAKQVRMHRIITNAQKGDYVDHINGNKLDNRKCNLRLCSNAENMRNRKAPVNNTSGFKGVTWSKIRNKWRSYIKVDYRFIDLGFFTDKNDAANAYNEAALKYFGEFAFINKV